MARAPRWSVEAVEHLSQRRVGERRQSKIRAREIQALRDPVRDCDAYEARGFRGRDTVRRILDRERGAGLDTDRGARGEIRVRRRLARDLVRVAGERREPVPETQALEV